MGDIARVHHQQLQFLLADRRAWAKAQQPRDTLAEKIAYVSAGIGLVALIGFGVVAQRRKRRQPPPEAEPEVEPNQLAEEEPVEELAGKSST